MRRILFFTGLVTALVASFAAPGIPAGALDDTAGARPGKAGTFLVRMVDDPVAAHPATAPTPGQKVSPSSPRVQRYVAALDASHGAALDRAGVSRERKLYDYRYAYNGFSARLTPAEVQRLRRDPAVAAVVADTLATPQTDRSPSFLELTGEGQLYDQLAGAPGEDVVVGVIDTGIWPEHPSFSDQTDLAFRPGKTGKRSLAYGPAPAGWAGRCQAGEQFSKDHCNNKLIGARYFIDGYRHWGVVKEDYESPRDADGHGSHTASTAAGNAVPAELVQLFGVARGPIQGIAHRARIAAYKVCWNGDAGGCATTDTVAAIDTAVADGVDVINYSIGGLSPALGEDDIAFLFAERAGVVIAGSAGNEGPGAGTVSAPHLTPWTIAVGASTHSRTFEATLHVGAASFTGASVTSAVGPAPIVDAALVDTVPASDATDGLCLAGTLPAAVAGKIVLCKRGITARVEKSLRVLEAGGVGMALFNAVSPQETVTDNHYLPSVHLTLEDGLAVKALLGGGATPSATISAGVATDWAGDVMAAFSSRGENRASPDLITPDVTAPGVNILAAASPTPLLGAPGQLYQSISGTSMSSPHVAGAAALLRQRHPTWTPAMIKSALMTSGTTAVVKEDGVTPADPFDMGGGRIRPTAAADPGLVFPSGYTDYRNFLCTVEDLGCAAAFPGLDPALLNLASIGVSQLAGVRSVTRTVSNVGPAATYTAVVAEPAGVDVTVTPSSLTLATGASATFTVTFTTDTSESPTFDAWAFGSVTWSDGAGHAVRSPVAVRPVRLAFPVEVTSSEATSQPEWSVQFGYTGTFSALPSGPAAATVIASTVADDPANDIETALVSGVGIVVRTVDVSAADFARFALFTAETGSPDNDLDLYVFADANGNGTFEHDEDELLDLSGSGTSDEQVDITPGDQETLFVVVHGWQTAGSAPTTYRLSEWVLGPTTPTAMAVSAPATALLGTTGTVRAAWSGLTVGTRYVGLVRYGDGATPLGHTVMTITP